MVLLWYDIVFAVIFLFFFFLSLFFLHCILWVPLCVQGSYTTFYNPPRQSNNLIKGLLGSCFLYGGQIPKTL